MTPTNELPATASDEERAAFARLQARLLPLWQKTVSERSFEHTSVVVPSLSFDPEELAKISGISFYEERLLFVLMRLRNPGARVLYVTSQPIHPEIIDYYLHLLVGVPSGHARNRLGILSMMDSSPIPLTQKILDRPRAIARMRAWIGNRRRAYLTSFNSTGLERRLALELGIPLNGLDPELVDLGTKTGSREAFVAAGVPHALGAQGLRTRKECVEALVDLEKNRPGLRAAVVKLNHSFSGEGNAQLQFPPEQVGSKDRAQAIDAALEQLSFNAEEESTATFFRKFAAAGGVVEELVTGSNMTAPSVQMRIRPDGHPSLISTHEQVLGGPHNQAYVGCQFPASDSYRMLISEQARKVADVLAQRGVLGRFSVDFLAWQSEGQWEVAAIEINLRMGGTTHPFQALEFLTSGTLDEKTGLFVAPGGQEKFYFSTDALVSPFYRGLLPEDLLNILAHHGLNFRPSQQSGVLFHMIGALSQFGKIGVTCIGDSHEQAQQLYEWTVRILDEETGATGSHRGRLEDPFHERLPQME